jgi:dolichol kinase
MVYRFEIIRKLIHFASALIAIIYLFFFVKEKAILIIGFLTCFMITAELLRMNVSFIRNLFSKVFGKLLRMHEYKKITASTWLFIGAFFTILFFPKEVAVISLLFMSVGDSCAALVGKKWGKIKIFDKTLEGSVAFLSSAIFISLLYREIPYYSSFVGAFFATIAELLPLPLNDNLTIPLITGVSIVVANSII